MKYLVASLYNYCNCYVEGLNLPKAAKIIDVGGGESNLVDVLLDKGFQNI